MIDYAALKTELQTDPLGLGYAAMLDVEKSTTQKQIDKAPKDEEGKSKWKYKVGEKYRAGRSDVGLVALLTEVRLSIVLSYTDERTNLTVVRSGSRLEQLFGPGSTLTSFDVAIAFDPARTP